MTWMFCKKQIQSGNSGALFQGYHINDGTLAFLFSKNLYQYFCNMSTHKNHPRRFKNDAGVSLTLRVWFDFLLVFFYLEFYFHWEAIFGRMSMFFSSCFFYSLSKFGSCTPAVFSAFTLRVMSWFYSRGCFGKPDVLLHLSQHCVTASHYWNGCRWMQTQAALTVKSLSRSHCLAIISVFSPWFPLCLLLHMESFESGEKLRHLKDRHKELWYSHRGMTQVIWMARLRDV